MRGWFVAGVVATVIFARPACAEETVTRGDFEALKKEIADIRRENTTLKGSRAPISGGVEKALDAKYGPNATVQTKTGKLQIGGLVKVWYYAIQNDSRGLFDDPDLNGIVDTNEGSDNDSFRIRRAEIHFNYTLNDHISARVVIDPAREVIDPAREATSFPGVPSNQGLFKRTANTATGSTIAGVQTGAATAGRALQDAFLTYKNLFPHHDVIVGQFKPLFGGESLTSAAELDFVERSFIGQIGDTRDLGASIRGTWVDDRVQYWFGAFDGAGNYFASGGQQQNRSDDNDAKDFAVRLAGRPVWKNEKWGSLDLGGSASWGVHGESGGPDTVGAPVAGLNRESTDASRLALWGNYQPGGPVSGFWLRGEWARFKDRHAPASVIDVLKNDLNANGLQDNPNPFSVQGWYLSAGYNLGQSPYTKSLPAWARKFEGASRYQAFDNVQVADTVNPQRTDVYRTSVYTAGVNYYLSGNNAKIQLNYNWVIDPRSQNPNISLHNVRNDYLSVAFQVAW